MRGGITVSLESQFAVMESTARYGQEEKLCINIAIYLVFLSLSVLLTLQRFDSLRKNKKTYIFL